MAECIREETSEREDSIIGGRSDRRCLTEAAKPCVVRGHSSLFGLFFVLLLGKLRAYHILPEPNFVQINVFYLLLESPVKENT